MTSVVVSSVTNTVTVTEGDGSSTVVTVPVTSTVTATTVGPQGPKGDAGTAFEYVQAAPATTWTINHNLGFRPSVELLDAGSQEIDGEVAHPTVNQTVVTLSPASAGLARLI
jgi:hypothetical protein